MASERSREQAIKVVEHLDGTDSFEQCVVAIAEALDAARAEEREAIAQWHDMRALQIEDARRILEPTFILDTEAMNHRKAAANIRARAKEAGDG